MIAQAAGFGFWLLAVGVLARLAIIAARTTGIPARRWAVWGLVLATGAGLLFRPHEDIFGGQDGGAYLGFGARLGRGSPLNYEDPLLAQIQPESARLGFLYYGPGRPYLSKFACGQVKDLERARMGPWFQVAYPLALSTAARVGRAEWILYVVPLFALAAAFAAGVLAALLIANPWAGPLASLFYLATPLLVWHARGPRPEVVAGFLLLAGGALLINAWRGARWTRWGDVLLGAVCVALAPFFHVTAWMAAVPAGLVVLAIIASGRDDFLLYPAAALVGLAAFATQSLFLCDTYGLRRFLAPLRQYPPLAALAGMAALTALAAAWFWLRRRRARGRPAPARPEDSADRRPILTAALIVAACVACAVTAVLTPPSKYLQLHHYFYRTNVMTVAAMISWPVALLALAGLVALALRRGAGWRERTAWLLAMVPAPLMIGNMYDLFSTRYLLVTLLPLAAVGLASLVALIPASTRAGRAALLAAALAVCGLQLRHRSHLVTTVEFAGFARFLRGFADTVRQADGWLLAEYMRIAAPFDHVFGIPTLGLHNERDDDYARAERSWADLMRAHPDRAAFFLTPYGHPPLSTHFAFTPVQSGMYAGRHMVPKRWALPTETAVWTCRLRLYRTTLADAGAPAPPLPYRAAFDAGNMGFRRFGATRRMSDIRVPVRPVVADQPLTLAVSCAGGAPAGAQVWLFCPADPATNGPPHVLVSSGAELLTGAWTSLPGNGWLWRGALPSKVPAGRTLVVGSPEGAALSAARLVWEGNVVPVFDADPAEGVTAAVEPFTARWARIGSGLLLPTPGSNALYACTFALLPGEEPQCTSLAVRAGVRGAPVTRTLPAGVWRWEVWPLAPRGPRSPCRWLSFETDRTVDLRRGGYPGDLALLLGQAVALEAGPPP